MAEYEHAPRPNNNGFFSEVPSKTVIEFAEVLTDKLKQIHQVMTKMESIKPDNNLSNVLAKVTSALNEIHVVVSTPISEHSDSPSGLTPRR